MNINDILKYGESKLENITQDYLIDARLLLEHVLECNRMYLLLNKFEEVDAHKIHLYEKVIQRRASGEPLQYIVGTQEFMGLTFIVAPGVLIPRSDTEPLVEALMKRMKGNEHFLDIGTGSGAIHISLLHHFKNATAVSVDISAEALEIAKKNAENLKVTNRIKYLESNLFEKIHEKFDVIVSNPPYIPTEDLKTLQKELSHEPKIALDGGDDGYDFYRAIIKAAPEYFNEAGLLAFEVGHDQARTIKKLLEDADYQHIEIIEDLSHIERVVIARYERL